MIIVKNYLTVVFKLSHLVDIPICYLYYWHRISTQPKMEISFVITSKLMMPIHIPRHTAIHKDNLALPTRALSKFHRHSHNLSQTCRGAYAVTWKGLHRTRYPGLSLATTQTTKRILIIQVDFYASIFRIATNSWCMASSLTFTFSRRTLCVVKNLLFAEPWSTRARIDMAQNH